MKQESKPRYYIGKRQYVPEESDLLCASSSDTASFGSTATRKLYRTGKGSYFLVSESQGMETRVLCKLIYALFKLILISVVADFKPFFYRCACHVVADDVFQDQGIMPFPEEGIALQEPFPSGVPLQEPVNPFPDIAVRWLCAVR